MDQGQARETYQEALGLYQQGRYEDALRLLDQLEEQNPGNPDVMFGRAQCMAQLGRRQEALAIADDLSLYHGDPRGEQLKSKLGRQGPGSDPLGIGASPAPAPQPIPPQKRSGGAKWLIGAVVALVILGVAAGLVWFMQGDGETTTGPGGEAISGPASVEELLRRSDQAAKALGTYTMYLDFTASVQQGANGNGEMSATGSATLDTVAAEPPKVAAELDVDLEISREAGGGQEVNISMPLALRFVSDGAASGAVLETPAGKFAIRNPMESAEARGMMTLSTLDIPEQLDRLKEEGYQAALAPQTTTGYVVRLSPAPGVASANAPAVDIYFNKQTYLPTRAKVQGGQVSAQVDIAIGNKGAEFADDHFAFDPPPDAQAIDPSQMGGAFGAPGGMQGGF